MTTWTPSPFMQHHQSLWTTNLVFCDKWASRENLHALLLYACDGRDARPTEMVILHFYQDKFDKNDHQWRTMSLGGATGTENPQNCS